MGSGKSRHPARYEATSSAVTGLELEGIVGLEQKAVFLVARFPWFEMARPFYTYN
jgi:hypothetical protein